MRTVWQVCCNICHRFLHYCVKNFSVHPLEETIEEAILMLFVIKKVINKPKSSLPHPFTAYVMNQSPKLMSTWYQSWIDRTKSLSLRPCYVLCYKALVGFTCKIIVDTVRGKKKVQPRWWILKVIHRRKKKKKHASVWKKRHVVEMGATESLSLSWVTEIALIQTFTVITSI